MLKCGISPAYVLDEMPLYEVDLFTSYLYLVDKAAAERMRMMMWMTAQTNSTKRIKPEDIVEFAWEREQKQPAEPMTPERWELLQEHARAMREKINK